LERAADGLEPELRLGVLWQRVLDAALGTTQRGQYHQRGLARLKGDQALAETPQDVVCEMPDVVDFWLSLGRAAGVLEKADGAMRLEAISFPRWRQLAHRMGEEWPRHWGGLQSWDECAGAVDIQDARYGDPGRPGIRRLVMEGLVSVPRGRWVALEELQSWVVKTWDQRPAARAGGDRSAGRAGLGQGGVRTEEELAERLRRIVQGPGLLLGLIKLAEHSRSGRAVVQATEQLRRAWIGEKNEAGEEGETVPCLWVQPNLEIIAYRQGLDLELVTELCCWADFVQVGAVAQLRMSADSIARGLHQGGNVESWLETLRERSTREIPASVNEQIRTWARRRQRVTFYTDATILEFATRAERDRAMGFWPEGRGVGAIGEVMLLVEDADTIPLGRFRQLGSRDYRLPPGQIVEVDADGLTLRVDLSKSDLMIESELTRFTEAVEEAADPGREKGKLERRYRVTPASVANAARSGWGMSDWRHWFEQRTGGELPAAVQLLVEFSGKNATRSVALRRMVCVETERADWAEGIVALAEAKGVRVQRQGPCILEVAEADLAALLHLLEAYEIPVRDTRVEE
jgi:hypothetical protein